MILSEPDFTNPPPTEAGPARPVSAPDRTEWTWEEYDADRRSSWQRFLTNPRDPRAPGWVAGILRRLLHNQVLLIGGDREYLEVVCEWPELALLIGLGEDEVRRLHELGARLLTQPRDGEEVLDDAAKGPKASEPSEPDPDGWDTYRRLKTAQRDLAAQREIPFRVEGVRRVKVTVQRHEREVWQVLADFGRPEPLADRDGIFQHWPWHSHRIISLPVGNRQRDGQLAWAREHAPLEVRLVMYWKDLSGDRRMLCLRRERPR